MPTPTTKNIHISFFQKATIAVIITTAFLYVTLYEIEHQIYKSFKIDIDVSNADILSLISENILRSTTILAIIIGVILIIIFQYLLIILYEKWLVKIFSAVRKKIEARPPSFINKTILLIISTSSGATVKKDLIPLSIITVILVFFLAIPVSREIGKERAFILQEKILNDSAETILINLKSGPLKIHPLKCDNQICIGAYKLDREGIDPNQLFITTFDVRLYSKPINTTPTKKGLITWLARQLD